MAGRKYKVLIADDEYWTREKIRRMIEWEKYSLICLEPACDGEEVLSRMKAEQVDILITDINMPYISGVDLLRRLQEQYPDVVTFVVSGYDDFEYVKNSFLAGSVNYLLKPVRKIELASALSIALEKISERQNRNLESQKLSSFLQDREFSRLLEKENIPITPKIAVDSKDDLSAMSLILVKIHNMHELSSQYHYDQNLLSWSVKKKLGDLVRDRENAIIFNHLYRSNEFLLMTGGSDGEIGALAGKIVTYFSTVIQTPVTVVVSEQVFSLDSIQRAYAQTISCLMTRNFSGEDQIIFCRQNREVQKRKVETGFGEAEAQELKHLFRNKSAGEVKDYIRSIALRDNKPQKLSYLEIRQLVRQLLNLIQSLYIEDMNSEDVVALESMADYADKVVEQMNEKTLLEALNEVVDFAFSIRQEQITDSTRGLIKKAAAYIDEHYFEELTLSVLAGQFHVESSYFSRLFRQETGKNVMMYIADARVEKARQYIREGKHSLTEIAFLTGYDDYTYFNRVFRKTVGMSPREYKNSVGAQVRQE